jgi:hypothetical protein
MTFQPSMLNILVRNEIYIPWWYRDYKSTIWFWFLVSVLSSISHFPSFKIQVLTKNISSRKLYFLSVSTPSHRITTEKIMKIKHFLFRFDERREKQNKNTSRFAIRNTLVHVDIKDNISRQDFGLTLLKRSKILIPSPHRKHL